MPTLALALLLLLPPVAALPDDGPVLWLEQLDTGPLVQGWGSPGLACSVDGGPLSIGGRSFEHGVGTHAESEWILALHGAARRLSAQVGVDDEVGERGSVVFEVWVDGERRLRTPVLHGGEAPVPVDVDLAGADELVLVVGDGGDHIHYDHADWADGRLVLDPAAGTRPQAVARPPDPPPELARGDPPEPQVHSPRITGASPGAPFLFRVPATGTPPLTFAAEGLPPGLVLDPRTGILTGALQDVGRWPVTVRVSGPAGETEDSLVIVGGERSLALTPPMGWNSWNVWGTAVDAAKVRAAARALVSSGLAAHGYAYVNIDDAWEGERDEAGVLGSNEKFPDMAALAADVHALGLKLGIYSSPGPLTCAGFPGSHDHEHQDADTWAAWGIDYLKYDWCSYGGLAPDDSELELARPYVTMRLALDGCGRDIVYSLCQYGLGDVWTWGAQVGGNLWRTTGDIDDTWGRMSALGFGQAGLSDFAGPGHWNDPDMLVVGQLGWGPALHPTRLTPWEQVTHVTLWSLLAAPLLIGCDLEQLDDFTLALLTNPEVLDVDQDPLGRAARRVTAEGEAEVWARPLQDGSLAVGLFNRGRAEGDVRVLWEQLGLHGEHTLRDLWRRKELGRKVAGLTLTLPRHGAALLKVR